MIERNKDGHRKYGKEVCTECGKPLVRQQRKNHTGLCRLHAAKQDKRRNSIRLSKLNEKNPMWKGDSVGYAGLHVWVKGKLNAPIRCEECRKIKNLDLANISGKYQRSLTDWKWLCRRCHMISDGRLERLKERMRNRFKKKS